MADDQLIDTYVPEITGLEAEVLDATEAPLTVTTGVGSITISGRTVTVPTQVYTYAASSDTYDDLILLTKRLGVGDGVTATFSATLSITVPPIIYSTITITDGQSLISDVSNDMLPSTRVSFSETYNGLGTFQGDGTGTIDYSTGIMTVTFNTPPPAGVNVDVQYLNIDHIPVENGDVPPARLYNTTRLQKVVTDSSAVLSIERLAETDWDRHLFLTGRIFQTREANELISVERYGRRKLGNTLHDDGDRVSGCELSVISPSVDVGGVSKMELKVTAGFVYLFGEVRRVPETTLYVDGVGDETVGLRVVHSYITEDQDSNLRDPSTGLDGSGEPGAWREKVVAQWRANDENAVPVFWLSNGSVLNDQPATQFSDINRVLARRTYDESGNYKVRGFRVSFRPRYDAVYTDEVDDYHLTLDVDGGKAYVQGFEVNKPTSSSQIYQKASDTNSISDGFTYKPSAGSTKELYKLGKLPVARVASVSTLARTPLMRITRASAGQDDDLPAQSAEQNGTEQGTLYAVIPNDSAPPNSTSRIRLSTSSTYNDTDAPSWVEGTDFNVSATGDVITWVGGHGPTAGATYYGYWNYDTNPLLSKHPLIKGSRLLTMVTGEAHTAGTLGVAISLNHGDIASSKLVKVYDAAGRVYARNVDYTIGSGRNNTGNYTNGTITFLTSGTGPSSGTFYVDYGWWDHTVPIWDNKWVNAFGDSAEGDYLAIDSYLEETNTGTLTFATQPGKKYRICYGLTGVSVRNAIDFRCKGIYSGGINRKIATKTDGSGYQVSPNYTYFLPRIDVVSIDKNGRIVVTYGQSAAQPRPPFVPGDVLRLCQVYHQPFTRYPVITEATTNRSTMEDVQNLRRRVELLEIDVATSHLEDSATSSARNYLIRAIFTDSFKSFDHMQLDYDQICKFPQPALWAANTVYVPGDTVRNAANTLYMRCKRGGTSVGVEPSFSTSVGGTIYENGVGTVKWRTYAAATTTPAFSQTVKHDVAVDNLAGSLRMPCRLTTSTSRLKDYVNVTSSTAKTHKQLVTLPYTEIHDSTIYQRFASEATRLNSGASYAAAMSLDLEPAADIIPDTERQPDLLGNLPGGTITNLSAQYAATRGGDSFPETDASTDPDENDSPVHPLPDEALSHINNWWSQFHSGIPIELLALNAELSPGVQADVTAAGNQETWIDQSGDQNTMGTGFTPRELDLAISTPVQQIGNVVLSSAMTLYSRQSEITVSGSEFPALTDISCKINDRQVPLTLVTGLEGIEPGTVRAVSDSTEDSYGSFSAKLTLPENLPTGRVPIEFTAAGETVSTTFVTAGALQVDHPTYSSVSIVPTWYASATAPIAQVFTAGSDDWFSSCSLYFYSKNTVFGVRVEVRDVSNGLPGSTVLGRARIKASNVVTSDNATKATTVQFDDPIYLKKGQEYALVVYTYVRSYKIFTATYGIKDVQTGSTVTKSANIGPLFRSTNNRTWEMDPYSVLKFDFYRAKFTTQAATVAFNPVTGVVASHLILLVTQMAPPSTSIKWWFSTDNTNFIPLRPNIQAKLSSIFRTIYLRADMVGGVVDGKPTSPAFNWQHFGLLGYTFTGQRIPSTQEYPNQIEANYISENISIGSGIETLRTVVEEYRPTADTILRQYFSADNGATWVEYPNNTSAVPEYETNFSSYVESSLGGDIYEVTRTQLFHPVGVPAALQTFTTANSGGALTGNTTYYIQYTFKNTFGESLPSAQQSQTTATGGTGTAAKITFDLPTGTSYPTNTSYMSGAPVSGLTGINVYMSTTTGQAKLLAPASWTYTDPFGANATITVTSATLDASQAAVPTQDTTVPYQFRTRIQLVAPYQTDLIETPAAKLAGFSYVNSGGSVPNVNHTVVLSWVSADGETAPSPSLGVGEYAAPPAGSTNIITLTLPAFPPHAVGAKIFIKPVSDGSNPERWVQNVQVVRGGVVTQTNMILPTDSGPFQIISIPTVGGPYPLTVNTTGPLTATAPQVSKLRVIAHDEDVL